MPKKDATDKGVSSEKEDTVDEIVEEEKAVGTGHASAIEEIAATVRKDHFDEIGIDPDEEEKDEGDKDDDKTEEDTETEEAEVEQKEEEDTKEDEKEPEKITVKVDGEEQEVTKDDLIREYQKGQAADKRLEEATKLLKDAKDIQPSEKDADKEEEEEDAKPDFAAIKANMVQAIQYGEDDDVDKAFEDLIGALGTGQDTPTLDKTAIIAEVKEELKAENIVTNFGKEPKDGGYKDLQDDPKAYMLVQMEVDKLLKDGDPNNWATYQKAGEETRKFLGWKDPTPDKDNKLKTAKDEKDDKAMEKKRDKKRKIDSIDTVSASKQSRDDEKKPETPQETVKAMAQSRPGQEIY